MAEQPQELRRVCWSECIPVTQVFRSFRIAVHPTKLALGLMGLILTVVVGLLMSWIWAAAGVVVYSGEAHAYRGGIDLEAWRDSRLEAAVARVAPMLVSEEVTLEQARKKARGDLSGTLDRLRKKAVDTYEDKIDKARDKEGNQAAKAVQAARRKAVARLDALAGLGKTGIFKEFAGYQCDVLRRAVAAATRDFSLLGGIEYVASRRNSPPDDSLNRFGVIPCFALGLIGVKWLVCEHWFYALVFLLVTLAIWSILGGAICRIAAMQAARDEKIPLKQALAFARKKFVGFYTAPLIPLLLIVFIGVFLALGGLVGAIPGVGEVLTGVLLFLALLGGFVMTLVAIGAVGGAPLMWPTIAVEGSDSFDAISRSFSYVYSKPWRSLFMALVAGVYGALCYVFARVFVFVMLWLTHFFVGIGMFPERAGAGVGANKLEAMWQTPSLDVLVPTSSSVGLMRAEGFSAHLIHFWVMIVLGFVAAFLVSFFFSASTMIYYLLRRDVDATDLEDVYLDEYEEEELEPAPSPAEAPAPAPEPAPAPSPAESPPVQLKPPAGPPDEKPAEDKAPETSEEGEKTAGSGDQKDQKDTEDDD